MIDVWCRGSIKEGLGHIIRSITLVNLLKKKKFKVNLVIESDQFIRSSLKNINIVCKFIKLNESFLKINSKNKICIIDRFRYNNIPINFLKEKYEKCIFFDELKKIKFFNKLTCKDIIIQSQLTSKKKIKKHNFTYLSGLKYFVVNKKKKYKAYQKKTIDILVMFGGGLGYFKYYYNIAKYLKKLLPDKFKIFFILGGCYNKKNYLRIKNLSKKFQILSFIKDPISLMFKSKIGIFSGGYSKYEASFAKLPSLIIPVRKHQVDIAKLFCKYGGGIYIKNIFQEKNILKKINILLKDKKLYKKISLQTSKLIDGKASERIINFI